MPDTPDLVTFGETMLRLGTPDGERLETTASLDVRIGGAESNVAVTAQRLGLETMWCSRLPDSPLGRRVVHPLQAHGVTVEVDLDDSRRQGTYFIESGGTPRGTSVIYDRENAAVTTATPETLPMETIRDAEAFLTTGITPALSETLEETTKTVLREASTAGTTTIFDVNYRSKLWGPNEAAETLRALFPDVDILLIADRDAEHVFDRSSDPTDIGVELRQEYDLDLVIVTAGDQGSVAVGTEGIVKQDVLEANTVDPIGTGDAFLGGFLAWYLDGASLERSMEAAAATASLKRTISGDLAVVTRDEVEEAMSFVSAGIDR